MMFEVFMDIFTYRDNCLRRLDARKKLTIVLAAVLAVICSKNPLLPAAVFSASLIGMIFLKMPSKLLLLRITVPLGMAVVLAALQSLLIGSTPVFVFHIAALKVSILREGLLQGILIGSRVMGATSVVLLLSACTPAYEVFHALRWFRVPKEWVETAVLTYRYTFILLDLTSDIGAAQRLRLGYSRLDRSLSAVGALAGMVVIRAVDQALQTHAAMVLRGYRGQAVFGPLPALKAVDLMLVTGVVAILAGAFFLLGRMPL